MAQQGGQRLLNLINAILDVNRLESGQMPLEREPVRLDIIAAEMVEMEQVSTRDKHLTLENTVRSDLPLVSVDVELLRRVLQNLIGNAIKFTPAGGHIAIEAQVDSADPQTRRLRQRRRPRHCAGPASAPVPEVCQRAGCVAVAAGWVWPSAVWWSKRTVAASGWNRRPAAARCSVSRCPWPKNETIFPIAFAALLTIMKVAN